MTFQIYLVPEEIIAGLRKPAYVDEAGVMNWVAMDYGPEPVFLVGADVTLAQHTLISNGVGTVSLPADLSAIPAGAALTQTKAALETLNIPSGAWLDGLTYRQIIRVVACIFQFLQRWRGLGGGRIFTGGVTLNATIGSLPLAARNRLRAVADSFGWDYSSVTGVTTIREALRILGAQWARLPITLGMEL